MTTNHEAVGSNPSEETKLFVSVTVSITDGVLECFVSRTVVNDLETKDH